MPPIVAPYGSTEVVAALILAVLLLTMYHKRGILSGYLRTLTSEFLAASADHKAAIARKTALVTRRMDYVAKGQRCLYAAALCFLFILLVSLLFLVVTFSRGLQAVVFYCGIVPFLAGTFLTGGAVILELKELALADAAFHAEFADVTDPPGPASNI